MCKVSKYNNFQFAQTIHLKYFNLNLDLTYLRIDQVTADLNFEFSLFWNFIFNRKSTKRRKKRFRIRNERESNKLKQKKKNTLDILQNSAVHVVCMPCWRQICRSVGKPGTPMRPPSPVAAVAQTRTRHYFRKRRKIWKGHTFWFQVQRRPVG